jgi:hypothetical protein
VKRWVAILVLILAVLHQDFWLWDDATLVGGIIPSGLAYHALYSVVVGLFWLLVVTRAWPDDLDEDDEVIP